MSTVDAPAPAAPAPVLRNPVRAWLRLLRAELRLVFLRKRNMLLLAVTVVFPVIIGIALRVAAPHPQGGGNGPGVAFFNQLAGNGVFLAFITLSTLLILVLPVVVAVVAGDSVAGEARLRDAALPARGAGRENPVARGEVRRDRAVRAVRDGHRVRGIARCRRLACSRSGR